LESIESLESEEDQEEKVGEKIIEKEKIEKSVVIYKLLINKNSK
jgi:hypothetical protein